MITLNIKMLWIFLPALLGSVYARKICDADYFYNVTSEQCQRCSRCSSGEPLRRRCSEINDTLCGLINFSFSESEADNVHFTRKDVTPTVLADDDEKYWKTLAFALIGLLSVLVVVATLIVLVTCYKFRHTGWFCKHVQPEQEDVENGYVVIHKFIPDGPVISSSNNHSNAYVGATPQSQESQPFVQNVSHQRSNKPYRPKRRMMNEYIDEVFESDDSGGSRSLRHYLETIPERKEST